MKRSLFLLLLAWPASADWQEIATGIRYQRFQTRSSDVHVARVELGKVDVVATREEDRGIRVSDFARRTGAIVAINGDFFDRERRPIGLTIGPCGRWEHSKDNARQSVVAFGSRRVEIYAGADVTAARSWMTAAVGGFPTLISGCRVRKTLPGPRRFTHAPHARSAIGFSRDEKVMYLVAVDGRRQGAPGMTLPQLAAWMREMLEVCSAINLDGGGSSAFWVGGRLVNDPSDGFERRVANHLGVVPAGSAAAVCDQTGPK